MVIFGLVAGSWWMIIGLLNDRTPHWLKFWRGRNGASGSMTMSLTNKNPESV